MEPSLDHAAEPAVAVAIVGAGFGGIGMAIRLKRAGRNDFVLLDQAADVGGTWRDNTYPGCACDIPADLYSFSFAPDWDWSRRYPAQGEIQAYLLDCVARFGIRPHLRLGTGLQEARFDADAGVWHLRTSTGPITARTLILALGALHRPALPPIPGLDRFRGPAFHTARWDHTVPLAGQRVAVIGTGASAIQLVPPVAEQAVAVTLFQRTPAWVLPKHDPETSNRRRTLYRRFPWLRRWRRAVTFWSHESRAIAFVSWPRLMQGVERRARSFAKATIIDETLRQRLTPEYSIGCKRVLLSNDFLPALNRDNVTVVGSAIAAITPDGVQTSDGITHRADVLVYATGFHATDPLGSVQIIGRDGHRLDQVWADGMHAWMGMAVAGFPNLFLLGGPNTGLGHNSVVFMLETQIGHILRQLARGARITEVTEAASARFRRWLDQRMQRTVWLSGCRSWYLDRNGRNTTLWPGYCVGYWLRTRFASDRTYRDADRAQY